MIPIRDTIKSRRFPLVNYTFIALCGFGFYLELQAGADIDPFLRNHGLIPAQVFALGTDASFFDPALYARFITSIFLHAGIMHFLGNMLFLWIFGDNVEDRMGHVGYAVFYVVGGVAAGLAHVVTNPESMIPTIGASGSIAAVMGAYIVLYPRARIVSAVIILVFVRVISVPAVIYLGLWFVLQLMSGTAALGAAPTEGGVAWWAHAGGFVFGAATVVLLGLRSSSSAE